MMRKDLILTFMFLFTALFFYGCKDDNNGDTPAPSENVAPVITLLSPISSAYNIGNLVKINTKVTDNVALKTILVEARNTTIDSVYVQQTFVTSDTLYSVTENFICNITTPMADFMVTIDAEDAAGNKSQSVHTFHVMD